MAEVVIGGDRRRTTAKISGGFALKWKGRKQKRGNVFVFCESCLVHFHLKWPFCFFVLF
jgi:hypothetical protein